MLPVENEVPVERSKAPDGVAAMADRELMERFRSNQDPEAFATLVRRHGTGVLRACQRVLRNPADAEDASQATFLLLLRKGGELQDHATVGRWLRGVARRVALQARKDAGRRRDHEGRAARDTGFESTSLERCDLRPLLEQEVGRLPEQYRTAVELCYFQGRTKGEVARVLGCPEGTVSGQLARARQWLRKQLAQRGFAPGPESSGAGPKKARK